MVAGRDFALICALMLLIHNNQTKTAKRSKKRGSRANHNRNFPVSGPLKLLIPLPGRQSGVNKGNLAAKPAAEAHNGLVGQGNFRNQQNDLFSQTADIVN